MDLSCGSSWILSSSRTGRPVTSCGRCMGRAVRPTRSASMPDGWQASWGGARARVSSGPRSAWRAWPVLSISSKPPLDQGGRLRSGTTVNATLTAVCEFLRFCARTGVIEQAVAGQLSEPRWLRFTPPGFDAGESGQFRRMRARSLKARAETAFPEAFTPEQAERVMARCQRPRERFMVTLLRDGGLRIGEALGLRRSDLHLLPDSRCVGCAVLGAHVHVRHRANPNGALAKSRFPRTVPASDAVLSAMPTTSTSGRRSSVRTTATWCSSTSTTNRWARR